MRCPFYGGRRGVIFVKLTGYAGESEFGVFECAGSAGRFVGMVPARLRNAIRVTANSDSAGGADGPLLEKREKWRTPVLFCRRSKKGPRYTFRADVAHPPPRSCYPRSTDMLDFEHWKREFRATHPAHTCVDRPRVYCEACRATLVSAPPAPLEVSIPAPSEHSPVSPNPSPLSVLPQMSHEDSDLVPNVDLLTNLPIFNSAFLRELEAAKQAETIAFIQADLDKFYALNIAHGHEVGNELLREIGDIFRRSCRPLGNRCVGPCRLGASRSRLLFSAWTKPPLDSQRE